MFLTVKELGILPAQQLVFEVNVLKIANKRPYKLQVVRELIVIGDADEVEFFEQILNVIAQNDL